MLTFRRASSTVPGSDFRVVMLGDSITAGSPVAQWFTYFATLVNAGLKAATPTVSASGPRLSSAPAASPTSSIIWFNSGIPGNDCTNYLSDTIAVRVTAYKPDMVIVMNGVNCQQHSGTPGTTGILTTDAQCTTNHPLIISQIQAQNPLAQLCWISALCHNENWPDGVNAFDTGPNSIDAKCAIDVAACAGASPPILNIQLRTAFFAYQAINNPTHANFGILTAPADGIHPSAVNNAGQPTNGCQFISDQVMPFVRYA
jgi:lysophospholipase L1-like esterase